MLYLLMFFLSSFFIYLGEHAKKKVKILYVVALTFPILMATLRDETIGIDVRTYVKPMVQIAKASNHIASYYQMMSRNFATRDLEKGFSLLGYIGVKLSGGIWGDFFIFQALVSIPVFWGIVNVQKILKKQGIKLSLTLSMFTFYCLFYNMSLTMIRQSIACALVFWALTFALVNKNVASIVIILFSSLIHATGLVGFALLVLFWFAKADEKKVFKYIIVFFAIVAVALGDRLYWIAMTFLSRFINIPGRYLTYAYMANQVGGGVNFAWLYLVVVSLVITTLLAKKYRNQIIINYLLLVSLMSVALFPLSIVSVNAGRIEYYFFYFFITGIPLIGYAYYFKRFGKKFNKILCICIALVYWLGTAGLNDYTGTVPYLLARL